MSLQRGSARTPGKTVRVATARTTSVAAVCDRQIGDPLAPCFGGHSPLGGHRPPLKAPRVLWQGLLTGLLFTSSSALALSMNKGPRRPPDLLPALDPISPSFWEQHGALVSVGC